MTNDQCQMTNEFPMTNAKLKIWIWGLIWILSLGICHSAFSAITGQPANRPTGQLKKGQSILEMSLLLVIIVAALIAMQVYLKRGIQGRLRSNADNIGEQYDPSTTVSDFSINHVSNTTTTTTSRDKVAGGFNRLLTQIDSKTHYDNTTRNGYEIVGVP